MRSVHRSAEEHGLAGGKLGAKTILVNPGYAPLLNKRAKDYAVAHGWFEDEPSRDKNRRARQRKIPAAAPDMDALDRINP